MILLLLATSPELLSMHLAALDRNLLEDPLILSAVKACADFLSVSGSAEIRFFFVVKTWKGYGGDFGYKCILLWVKYSVLS